MTYKVNYRPDRRSFMRWECKIYANNSYIGSAYFPNLKTLTEAIEKGLI